MASKSKSSAAKSSAKSSSKSKSQQAQAREAAAQPAGQRRAPTEPVKVGDEVTVNLERIPQNEFNDDHKLLFAHGMHGRSGRVTKLENGKHFVEGEYISAHVPVDVLEPGALDLLGHGRARKSTRKAPKAAKGNKKDKGEVKVPSQSKQAVL